LAGDRTSFAVNAPDRIDETIQALRTCIADFQFHLRGTPSPTGLRILSTEYRSVAEPASRELLAHDEGGVLTEAQREEVEELTALLSDCQIDICGPLLEEQDSDLPEPPEEGAECKQRLKSFL
jgi:hypothetical protein